MKKFLGRVVDYTLAAIWIPVLIYENVSMQRAKKKYSQSKE